MAVCGADHLQGPDVKVFTFVPEQHATAVCDTDHRSGSRENRASTAQTRCENAID